MKEKYRTQCCEKYIPGGHGWALGNTLGLWEGPEAGGKMLQAGEHSVARGRVGSRRASETMVLTKLPGLWSRADLGFRIVLPSRGTLDKALNLSQLQWSLLLDGHSNSPT